MLFKIEKIAPVKLDKVYNFKVTVNFTDSHRVSKRTTTWAEAVQFIKANSTPPYEPTWEEVTSNGRFTCD